MLLLSVKQKKKKAFNKKYAEFNNEPQKEYANNSGFEMDRRNATFYKRNVYQFVCHFTH